MRKEKEIVLMSISKDELETLIIDCVNACLKFYQPSPKTETVAQAEVPNFQNTLKKDELINILNV